MFRSRRILRAAAVAVAVTVAPCALADQADKKQPINYSANTGDVNYQTKVGNL